MLLKRKSIKITEAVTRVMEFAEKGDMQYLSLFDSSGFFLAEDLVSDQPIPPFDRSPYDGFAVRSMDTTNATTQSPSVLEVIGEVSAGQVFSGKIDRNEAVRIMTGAEIPIGCDAVIMKEAVKEVHLDGKPFIHVRRFIPENKNISFTGEDIKQGSVVVKKGKYINPGVTALLATFGYKDVPVIRKPRVGVLVTGSELLDVDEALQPGKIRNSNGFMIYSQILRAGGEAVYLGTFSDDIEVNVERILTSLDNLDVLITTGGVSVGDYDYMPQILQQLNANILFNKIAMRPGSVTTAAEKDGKLIFALSGNPSACYVGFELLARPFIRTLGGASNPFQDKTSAILGADFLKPNPFDRFVRARISIENGQLIATPLGLDKSGVVSTLADANCFIVFPAGTKDYRKGMQVQTILLES